MKKSTLLGLLLNLFIAFNYCYGQQDSIDVFGEFQDTIYFSNPIKIDTINSLKEFKRAFTIFDSLKSISGFVLRAGGYMNPISYFIALKRDTYFIVFPLLENAGPNSSIALTVSLIDFGDTIHKKIEFDYSTRIGNSGYGGGGDSTTMWSWSEEATGFEIWDLYSVKLMASFKSSYSHRAWPNNEDNQCLSVNPDIERDSIVFNPTAECNEPPNGKKHSRQVKYLVKSFGLIRQNK